MHAVCTKIFLEFVQRSMRNPCSISKFSFLFPPHPLHTQVQWNIFTVQSSDPALMLYQEERGGIAITKFYTPCRDVEENYRKATLGDNPLLGQLEGAGFRRSFYNLVSAEMDRNGPCIDKGVLQNSTPIVLCREIMKIKGSNLLPIL